MRCLPMMFSAALLLSAGLLVSTSPAAATMPALTLDRLRDRRASRTPPSPAMSHSGLLGHSSFTPYDLPFTPMKTSLPIPRTMRGRQNTNQAAELNPVGLRISTAHFRLTIESEDQGRRG